MSKLRPVIEAVVRIVGCCLVGLLVLAGCAGAETTGESPEPDREIAGETPTELLDSDIIPVGESPVRGGDDAWVTVVVFADFQCPFSARLAATLETVRRHYDDYTVRLVFKHHPLEQHRGSGPAARAAEAARSQDEFWEFHDALFDRQAELHGPEPEAAVFEIARSLDLDEERLREEMNSAGVADRIDDDRRLARKLDLDQIPAVFVNGGRISGARSADVYHSAIGNVDEVLRHGVLEGEIDPREVYRESVRVLYGETGSGADAQ